MIDNETKKDFLVKGKEKEKEFAVLFNEANFSTTEQDINEHWDVEISAKIDVKGLKKMRRSDEQTNEHFHYIELKGITGEKGWLYGEANYFAFELNNYWIIVDKSKLQQFVAENVKKEKVESPELYRLYRRKDRKDLMTLITSYDLCYLASQIIRKTN